MTDSAGNTIATNSYDDYGIPRNSANGDTAPYGRFGYVGQIWLPELGMYYYKARIYSPTLGRFMQTDPIGYADGLNWYNYVGSDPINATDPSGLECVDGAPGKTEQECLTHKGLINVVVTAPRFRNRARPKEDETDAFDRRFPAFSPVNYDGETGSIGSGGEGQRVNVDKSCPAGGPAHDPGVQEKALEAYRLAFSAQQSNPSGPPFREYGFTGRPYLLQFIFGPGFVTSDIKSGSQSQVDLSRGWLDTFDVHTHSQATGPSGPDIRGTPSGYTTIVIGRDRTLRCYVGK